MLDRARAGWSRNKWWLFERMVESPHRTAFFVRKDLNVREDADGNDNGGNDEWTEAARYWCVLSCSVASCNTEHAFR